MRCWPLLLLFICLSWSGLPAQAQLRQPAVTSAEILSDLQKLNVLGSVLYFAAHPDDENTRLIAWSAREMKYRTAYLSLTRGDGGQNLIGTELAEELGLIRTQELLAARRIDGGTQYFSRANDFGFSKTPEETLEFWGREAILADAVWVIRKHRPDVIITRFPPDPRGGHGHHQAATILAIEAFRAAADPSRFPEQLEFVEPWQARRLLWNAANFGGQNNTTASQFTVDIGAFNPLIGQSYGEVAAESRSSHKSQGFGAARQRGTSREFFEVLDGDAPETDLMDGVDVSWNRVEGAAHLESIINGIIERYDVRYPERSLNDLLALLTEMEGLKAGYWKEQKIAELKNIILACAGIWFESYADAAKVSVGQQAQVRTDFIVRRPGVEVSVEGAGPETQAHKWGQAQSQEPEQQQAQTQAQSQEPEQQQSQMQQQTPATSLRFNELAQVRSIFVPGQTTQPYWLRRERIQERFAVDDLADVGQPGNQDDPKMKIILRINGKTLEYERPVAFKYTHPVHGEIHQPLVVAPAVTANLNQSALAFASGNGDKIIDVVFTAHASRPFRVAATPQVPEGWSVSPANLELDFERKDQEITGRFTLTPDAGRIAARSGMAGRSSKDLLTFELQYTNPENGSTTKELANMIKTIDYQHIPLITYFPPANIRLSYINTGISAQRIGYITGAGDLVPDALRQIGMTVDILEEQDILDQDLSRYDAIISGIRAYNVNRRMGFIHSKLMEYVQNGGTYLMQYNVSSGLSTADFGPYPFKLSRLRVTDELSEVRTLLPENQVLNHPNKIDPADFDGWIQERGLYFAADIDPRYETPLSMNDAGEQALDGSVVVGRYGKGKFVYTSLAFFRQLPAGVPGAYRLFVNLLAKSTE